MKLKQARGLIGFGFFLGTIGQGVALCIWMTIFGVIAIALNE